MRADVKLGAVISLVVVFLAGGYYLYRDRQETAIPMKDASLSSVEPAGGGTALKPTSPQRAGDGKAPNSLSPERVGSKNVPDRTTPTARPRPGRPARAQPSAKRSSQSPARGDSDRRPLQPLQRESKPERDLAGALPQDGQADATNRPSLRRAAPTTPDSADSNRRSPVSPGAVGTASPNRLRTTNTPGGQEAESKTTPTGDQTRSLQTAAGKRTEPTVSTTDPPAVRPRRSPRRRPGPAERQGSLPGGSKATERVTDAVANPKAKPLNPASKAKTDSGGVATDTHRVQSGDTFSSLAQAYYGHVRHTKFLMDSNPDVQNPSRLEVGALIRIPPLPAGVETGSASEPVVKKASAVPDAPARRTYTVKVGDTFYGVARDVLGDASRWKELLGLNQELVGGDPTRLQVGQVIVLPES